MIIDGQTQTTLNTSGNKTEVTTQCIKGKNAFYSFKRFNVYQGNEVNMVFSASSENLINRVHDEKSQNL